MAPYRYPTTTSAVVVNVTFVTGSVSTAIFPSNSIPMGNYEPRKPLPKPEAKKLEMHDKRRKVFGPRQARWA